jgi:hypothetical protein
MFLMKALLDLKFRIFWGALWGLICVLMTPAFSLAGEANLVIPELSQEQNTLLLAGIVICLLGMVFGYYQFTQVKKLPAHPSMLDVAQTITSIISTTVSYNARIPGIVLFNPKNDFHQVGSNVSYFGKYTPSNTQSTGSKRFPYCKTNEAGTGQFPGNKEQNNQHHNQLNANQQNTDTHTGI